MSSFPLEVWEELWSDLDRGLQEPASLSELRWLARQGNLACEFARRDGGPQLFEVQAWAVDVGRRRGLLLQPREGLVSLRWGHPQALEYLLVALNWQAFGETPPSISIAISIEGDDSELVFLSTLPQGRERVRGPLVDYLAAQVGARFSPGELFRCPCLAQQQEMVGSPVDLDALNRSCMDDAEFERELIETFTAEGRRQLGSLALNYSSHTLHSLKGSAGMVGAMRLAEMLGQQEKALEKEHLPELEAEFNRVVAFLQSRLLQ
ncbi:MAG: Hpt domain-containing protein [Candidatus Eremiobacteraeota bacterium]|nr:Hpt domain-containing protein [Candidatus Eremiobacteraeota bacterium]